MTRQEHLNWAKQRALALVDAGDLPQALASMISDLRKHHELEGHPAIELGGILLFSGNLGNTKKMREFIEGFN